MRRLKNHIILIFSVLTFINVNAQAPEKINYQAVARDLSGSPLISSPLPNVVFDIRQGSATGIVVYSETQSLSTNQFGMFTAEIGGGTPTTGTFAAISWGLSSYYLQITIGVDVMPATQLLSVPYALFSKQSANGPPGANGNNSLATSTPEPAGLNCANGGQLIEVGVDDNADGTLQALEIDFSYYVCNGLNASAALTDTSATNELQTLSISNDTVFLSNGGFVVLPAALGDNWGSDIVNTSGTNISGDGTVGNPLMVADSINDADADPNNERITNFSVNGTMDSLIIVESGVGHAMPLSDLSDGDWTLGTGSDLFNTIDSIGIGTNDPKSLLQLGNFMHLFPVSMGGTEDYSVNTYNGYYDGTTIRSTTGGQAGFTILGHDSGNPVFQVQLFDSSFAAGADIMTGNPSVRMNLKDRGLAINSDNPDATLELAPIDSAALLIEVPDDLSQATILFADQNGDYLGIKPPANLGAGSFDLTLPLTLPGVTGAPLVSDLGGNLSWGSIAAPRWGQGAGVVTNTTDNIGIGTLTPQNLLDVEGGMVVGAAYSGTTTAPANGLIVEGRIGVQYATPGFALDVRDNSNSFATYIQQSSTTGSGLSIYNATTLSAQTVFEAVSDGGAFFVKGDGNIGFNEPSPTARMHSNGTIRFDNLSGPAPAVGAVLTSMDALGNAEWQPLPAAPTTNWTLSGSDIYNNNVGNVGIGTTSPAAKLHVFDANTNVNNSQLVIEANSSSGPQTFSGIEFRGNANAAGVGPTGRIKSYYVNPGYTSATTTFQTIAAGPSFVDVLSLTDGKVGIGTTLPTNLLHVSGNFTSVGMVGSFVDLQNTFGSSSSPAKVGIRFKTSNFPSGQHTKGGIIYSRTSTNARGDIHFLNNSNDDITEVDISTDTKMIIKNSGNVGIGTTTPTALLDVSGTFKLTDGTEAIDRVLTSDASGNATWQDSPTSINFGANTSSTAIPNGFTTAVVFSNVEYDNGGNYNAATGLFTAPETGVYHFDAAIALSTIGNYDYQLHLLRNGGTYKISYVRADAGSSIIYAIISADVYLPVSNTVSIGVYQTSGGPQAPVSAAPTSRVFFNGHLIR